LTIQAHPNGLRLLDDAQLERVVRLFARFDEDMDGQLGLQEFVLLMETLEGEAAPDAAPQEGWRAQSAKLHRRLAFQRADSTHRWFCPSPPARPPPPPGASTPPPPQPSLPDPPCLTLPT